MPFGSPGRTMNPTTEVATIEPSGSCFQSWVISPAFCTSSTSVAVDAAKTSAGKPFTMFWAWVVLPPNDIWKIRLWPLCASFHSDANIDVSLPYASYGLLWAASVIPGASAGVQAPPRVPPFVAALLLLPQPAAGAASDPAATAATAARICILYNLSPLSIDFVDYCKVPLPQ